MQQLDDAVNSIFFIRDSVPTKEMWDGVQEVHSKTLSLFIVLDHTSRKPYIPVLFRNMLEEIMKCRTRSLYAYSPQDCSMAC
jgi:hypothetical protein